MVGYISWKYNNACLPEEGYIEVVIMTKKEKISNFYKIKRFEGDDLRDGNIAVFYNRLITGSFWRSGQTIFYTDNVPCRTNVEELKSYKVCENCIHLTQGFHQIKGRKTYTFECGSFESKKKGKKVSLSDTCEKFFSKK